MEIQGIELQLADSKRPNHIALYKSMDGQNWTRLAFKVTVETQCRNIFGVALSSQPEDDFGYVCSSYGQPMSNNEEKVLVYTICRLSFLVAEKAIGS